MQETKRSILTLPLKTNKIILIKDAFVKEKTMKRKLENSLLVSPGNKEKKFKIDRVKMGYMGSCFLISHWISFY